MSSFFVAFLASAQARAGEVPSLSLEPGWNLLSLPPASELDELQARSEGLTFWEVTGMRACRCRGSSQTTCTSNNQENLSAFHRLGEAAMSNARTETHQAADGSTPAVNGSMQAVDGLTDLGSEGRLGRACFSYYWVWSSRARVLKIGAGRDDHALEGGLRDVLPLSEGVASSLRDAPVPSFGPGWQFFSVLSELVYGDAKAMRALRWDAKKQSFVLMAVGASFVPGFGYWVLAKEPATAGALLNDGLEGQSDNRPGDDERGFSQPRLSVVEPSEDVVYTQESWALLGGEVFDPALVGLYVNGVEISQTSGSFFEVMSLRPGKNVLKVTALNERGIEYTVQKTIIRDVSRPTIRLSVTEPEAGVLNPAVLVSAEIADHWLAGVSFQGVGLGAVSGFERRLVLADLSRGLSRFEVRAWDRSGGESWEAFGIYVDDQGNARVTNAWTTGPESSERPVWAFLDAESSEANTDFRVVFSDARGRASSFRFSEHVEGGASQRPKRAWIDGASLGGMTLEEVRSVSVTDVVPSTSTVSWSWGLLRAHEVPPILTADRVAPELVLDTPSSERVYTASPSVNIAGSVVDAHLWDVSIRGLQVAVESGPFSYSLRLFQPSTVVSVVARDGAFNESVARVEFILDQKAPEILLSHGASAVTYEDSFVLRGSVSEKHLDAVELKYDSGESVSLAVSDDFFEKRVPLEEGANTFVLRARDLAGNERTQAVRIRYVRELESLGRPRAPWAVGATSAAQTARLWWKSPRLFDDGQPIPQGAKLSYRVYREGVEVDEVAGVDYQGKIPEASGSYRYHVTALIRNASGGVQESTPSEPVEVEALSRIEAPSPGAFEVPAVLRGKELTEEQPATALSMFDGRTYAHVAFVSRADAAGPSQVFYVRSPEAGKAGSFASFKALAELDSKRYVGELSVTARGSRVSVGLTSKPRTPGEGLTEIQVFESEDGGQSFGAAKVVRSNRAWKRGLDMGYDANGDHHLVWGESNKVYYLGNLTGTPSNVFDVKKRESADERVKYKAQYAPHEETGCACEGCWCPESYLLSDEPNPEDGGRPTGPYVYRVEESYMVEPSLHIDADKINIVARRQRMWDNQSVPNPGWVAMAQNPIYSEKVVQRILPTRLVVGWRETWKVSEEAGDDGLLASLGHRYQYLYEGTWHEEDQIQLAQRPLVPGAWSQPEAGGWTPGQWLEDIASEWRIVVVANVLGAGSSESPSHPQVFTGPGGEMLVSYEDGPSSDPNTVGHNGIYVASSQDGGVHWSHPERVGRGYVPQLAVASTGESTVVFYRPGAARGPGDIYAVRNLTGSDFSVPSVLNTRPVRPVHWQDHGPDSDSLPGAPSLSANQDLVFVAWVQKGEAPGESDHIVTTRASRDAVFSHLDIGVAREVTAGKSVSFQVTAENKFHMRVEADETVQILRTFGEGPPSESLNHSEPTDLGFLSGAGSSFAGDAAAPSAGPGGDGSSLASFEAPIALSLAEGVGQVVLAAPGSASLALVEASALEVGISSSLVSSDDPASFAAQASVMPGNTRGNYARAVQLRDGLFRMTPGEGGGPFYYQVEYEPKPGEPSMGLDASVFADPEYRDSRHLAGFDRVWAYTQGIALAQLSRSADAYGEEARGIARYLCHHAVQEGGVIKGWPFSWNTHKDRWRDARLVTGATAWVIHGLGVFISSSAYQGSEAELGSWKSCYLNALSGLQDHRRRVRTEDGREVILMSAGWTTEGLERVQRPDLLSLPGSEAFATFREGHRFSYYSVLDAIGYEDFSLTSIRVCQALPGIDCHGLTPSDPAWQDYVLTEKEWALLRSRAKARNVVTEHNLDVLSVLNHALAHHEVLGPQGALHRTWFNEIKAWRDELRDGTFHFLWDQEGWRTEFEEALVAMENAPSNQVLTKVQSERRAARIRGMEAALLSNDLGRVVTGGELLDDHTGSYAFVPSRHTAIDNCSWLSLSVDYKTLGADGPKGEHGYVDRLGRCLKYTVLQYAKDLGYGVDGCSPEAASCPPRRTYRGTHYFQNAFKDPYIEPSELQESSYHLEATMGLILGLLRFVDAHPEYPGADDLLQEAYSLWAGAQGFVRDHGFVYSSQRIQDLSARLVSSTALVWFIDVYEFLEQRDNDLDRPLLPYDGSWAQRGQLWQVVDEALSAYGAMEPGLVASGRTQSDGLVYTLLADQALSVLVSSNQGHEEQAFFRAEGLVAMLGQGHAVVRSSGEALDVGRPSLASELLAYYALAWLVHRFPGNAGRSTIEAALVPALLAFLESKIVLGGGPLSGLVPTPQDPSVAQLEDNLLAYYVLSLASKVVTEASSEWDLDVVSVLQAHEEELWGGLVSLCGLADGATPARWAGEWGVDRSAVDGFHALMPCSLFAASTGVHDQALHLLDASRGVALRSVTPKGEWETHGVDVHAAFGAFARRALSMVDPRQDEIARVAFTAVGEADAGDSDQNEPTLSTALLTLLVDDPQGVFGAYGGSLTGRQSVFQPGALLGEDLGRVKRALADRFLDVLTALLASDFRTGRFDTLFSELVTLQRAHDEAFRVSTAASDEARWVSMQDILSRGLCETHRLVHQGSISVREALGMECGTVVLMLRRVLEARGSLTDGTWLASVELSDIGRSWSHVLDGVLEAGQWAGQEPVEIRLGDDRGLTGSVPSRYRFLEGQEPLELSPEASLVEMREALRRRLTVGLERGLASLDTNQSVAYELGFVDPIQAFHPASPAFWKRSALELRAVLSPRLKGRVQFTLRGIKTVAPHFPLGAVEANNVGQFRRWINAEAGGDLGVLARKVGVLPPDRGAWLSSMHRMLRTGVLPERDINGLLDGLGLEADEAAQWKQPFTLDFGPQVGVMGLAELRQASLNRDKPWWGIRQGFADARNPLDPVHDESEDRGALGEKWLLGSVQKMDVMITPLAGEHGNHAVYRDRPQCLFHLENRGAPEARYEAYIDGVPFGEAVVLPGLADASGPFDDLLAEHFVGGTRRPGGSLPASIELCGFVPSNVSIESGVEVKNTVTGESFWFRFPVREAAHCQTGEQVSSEDAVDLAASNEWGLRAYQSEDCGDGLMLQPRSPQSSGFELSSTHAFSAVQMVRGLRTAKQILRTTEKVQGASSAGLSLEQALGLVGGVTGAGSLLQASDEMKSEVSDLFWKGLRMLRDPPRGAWVAVGWVPAWEVFVESEAVVRELPIYNRNVSGEWEITDRFVDQAIYALVQPAVYNGPRLPLLDPAVPVFGHDITSKVAVYRYEGTVSLSLSAERRERVGIESPVDSALANGGTFPAWLNDFPPEFRYAIYYTLFIEPGLGEGGAQSKKEIGYDRPGIYAWDGDRGHFQNLVFQKQPSLPVDVQQPGYVWRGWPDTDWYVYGPPDEVDTFVNIRTYSAAAKKTAKTKKSSPKKSDPPKKEVPSKRLTAVDVVSRDRLKSLDTGLATLGVRLSAHGAAYTFSEEFTDLAHTLGAHLGVWTGAPGGTEEKTETVVPVFDKLSDQIKTVRVELAHDTLKIDAEKSFDAVEATVATFLLVTEKDALDRAIRPMGRKTHARLGALLQAPAAVVYDINEGEYVVYTRGAKKRPEPHEHLHMITHPNGSVPFGEADDFARAEAVKHWVPKAQSLNFKVNGGRWLREYTPKGDFVGMEVFAEEALLELEQQGELREDSVIELLNNLFQLPTGGEDTKAIAYARKQKPTPKVAHQLGWASWRKSRGPVISYVISLLDGGLFVVVPETSTFIFDMDNYTFEGVTTNIQPRNTAKKVALGFVPKDQKEPWFLYDAKTTQHYDRGGWEVRLNSTGTSPQTGGAQTTDGRQTGELSSKSTSDVLQDDVTLVRKRLERYGNGYERWSEAAQQILALEPVLLRLQTKAGETKMRTISEYDDVIQVVIAELSEIEGRLEQGHFQDYIPSRLEVAKSKLREFMSLTRGSRVYQGPELGGVGKIWASLLQEHAVVVRLKNQESLSVFPLDSETTEASQDWTLVLVHYAKDGDESIRDIDNWVKESVAPRRSGSQDAPTFFVVGEGWARQYSVRDGSFVNAVSPLYAYVYSVMLHAPWLEPTLKQAMAEGAGIDVQDISHAGKKAASSGMLPKLAAQTHEEQFGFLMPIHGLTKFSWAASLPAAQHLAPLLMPYIFLGAATDKEGAEAVRARQSLEETARTLVPDNQEEQWSITTPRRTVLHGGNSDAMKAAASKNFEALSERVKAQLGLVALEILTRFPAKEWLRPMPIVAASRTAFSEPELRALVSLASFSLPKTAHVIFVPDGAYFIVVDALKTGSFVSRFRHYQFLGVVTSHVVMSGGGYLRQHLRSVVGHIPEEQTESWFLLAADTSKPHHYDVHGEPVPEEKDTVRFAFQSDEPLSFETLVSYLRPELRAFLVYMYSEEYGYVLFHKSNSDLWRKVQEFDHRVIMYLTDDARGWIPRNALRSLDRQHYAFVAYRSISADLEIQVRIHKSRGNGNALNHPQKLNEAKKLGYTHVRFPGIVLQAPPRLKLHNKDLPVVELFHSREWWMERLRRWFALNPKTKDLQLSNLRLVVRGGVPTVASFDTDQGVIAVGWNSSLDSDDVAAVELEDALFRVE